MGRAIKRASQLGAKVIVFGSSGAKNVPDGFDMEKAFEQVVFVLKKREQFAVSMGSPLLLSR